MDGLADSLLYSCSASTELGRTCSQPVIHAFQEPNLSRARSHVLPILNQRRDRLSQMPSMREVIKQKLARKSLISPNRQMHSHPLQRAVLGGKSLSVNGLRPAGEMLLVHDIRSGNVLRELNLVDSETSLQSINNCKIICSPKQGRKMLVLAGDLVPRVDSIVAPAVCCVSLDTGERLFDLELPSSKSMPQEAAGRQFCSSLSCTRSDSTKTHVVLGCSTGALIAWSLGDIVPSGTNAPWREQQLKQALASASRR